MQQMARVLDADSLLNPGKLVYLFGELNKELLSAAKDKIKRVVILPQPSPELVLEGFKESLLDFFPPERAWSRRDRLPAAFRSRFNEQQLVELGGEDEGGASSSSVSRADDVWERNARILESVFGAGEESPGKLRVYHNRESEVREMQPLPRRRNLDDDVVGTRKSGRPFSKAEIEEAKEAITWFHDGLRYKKSEGKKKGNLVSKVATETHDLIWSHVQFIGHVRGVEVGDDFHNRGELKVLKPHTQDMRGVAFIRKENNPWGVRVANAVVDSSGQFDARGFTYAGTTVDADNEALVNSCMLNIPVRVISTKETRDGKLRYHGLFAVTRFWGPDARKMAEKKRSKAGKKAAGSDKPGVADMFVLEPCIRAEFRGNQIQ